jgi:hypothetical protein
VGQLARPDDDRRRWNLNRSVSGSEGREGRRAGESQRRSTVLVRTLSGCIDAAGRSTIRVEGCARLAERGVCAPKSGDRPSADAQLGFGIRWWRTTVTRSSIPATRAVRWTGPMTE